MSRLPRNTNPKYVRHISIRTNGALLRLLPTGEANQIIAGIIAKYQEVFEIVIFAYAILGNHLHLLAMAPRSNLWRFEQAVNREIAKRINRLQNARGHFWERRYDEQVVLEDEDILEAFLYVTCNAVSHGLVEHPMLWPGVNSYQHSLDGKDREYLFTDYTAYGKALRLAKNRGEEISIRDFQSAHYLKITPLPQYADLSLADRKEVLSSLIAQRITRIKKDRKDQGLGFLGRKQIKRQHHKDEPRSVKRSPRPICYTKSVEAKKLFLEWFLPWLDKFYEASKKFRSGDFSAIFPEHSIQPPIHYSLQSA